MPKTKFVLATLIALAGAAASAQDTAEPYRHPPAPVAAVVEAAPTPVVSLGPDRRRMLVLELASHPSIAELAESELRLGGLRINPHNDGPSRGSHFVAVSLLDIGDGTTTPVVGLPPLPRLGSPSWSPDGAQIAFTHTADDRVELWLVNAVDGLARRAADRALNATAGAPCQWRDESHLVCRFVAADRGGSPRRPVAPAGPVIRESSGRRAAARTYQDLLTDPHDEDLFAHHLAAQVTLVGLDGSVVALGSPGLHLNAEPSPDGRFLLVETLHRPFSYLVPFYRFPRRVAVWDAAGVEVRELVDLPLAEEVPIGRGAVPVGPRNHSWRADAPATLSWVEARDGGDPRAAAEIRDELLQLAAPFAGAADSVVELGLRYAGVVWGDDDVALVTESWWSTRQLRTWRVAPGRQERQARVLFERSFEDRYSDPGAPVLRRNDAGLSVLDLGAGGHTLYLAGAGASEEGDRPFLDRLDLETGTSERLWRSLPPSYESFVAFVDSEAGTFISRRESPDEVPNFLLRSAAADLTRLTDFPHPYPQLAGVHKEVVHYVREDGVDLQATLYLPPGKRPEDGPFPMLMWAYPREFKDARAASQVQGSPHRFNAISARGPLPLLAAGYAVFDGPSMPIVGEGDMEPNDRYVEQLVSSAAAAVDEVVRRGVAERHRIAVGGHSYGAFMTGNLLAHSDLFAAGVARSGAYNRTLTPFGFQAEERTFWEAPQVYFRMSPFMHADKVNEPLLMIHGEADNNSGTFPIQSERFYAALKGHGAKVRLVMLPHESHGYAARESLLHNWWEIVTWLDRYLGEDAETASGGGAE